MRPKLARFMQGRYGIDELGRFLMGTTFFILIMEMLTGWHVLTLVFWAIFILVYYRMFSRDYGKRYQENQRFLTARYMFNTKWHQIFYKKSNTYNNSGVKCQFQKLKREIQQRIQYHIYKCPNCSQKIRIPRGKGKIMVRCPKCNMEFMKKS